MRVVSWNMARNTFSKARHERAWHYLVALDPDIALVQEAAPPPWAVDRWDFVMEDVNEWGSAVVARRGLGVQRWTHDQRTSHDLAGLIATATLLMPDGTEMLLGSVHAPVLRKGSPLDLAGYEAEQIKLDEYSQPFYYDVPFAIYRDRSAGRRFLVSGDWNVSPRLWDEHHRGTHEQAFFRRATDNGWVNCYDRMHPGVEGQTWFKRGQLPYQMDHAFCDPATAALLSSCEIDPSPARVLRVSDHAPLVLDFSAGNGS